MIQNECKCATMTSMQVYYLIWYSTTIRTDESIPGLSDCYRNNKLKFQGYFPRQAMIEK